MNLLITRLITFLDQYATVGITRNQVDNRELAQSWSYNIISNPDCVSPAAKDIDDDLKLGLMPKSSYSKG